MITKKEFILNLLEKRFKEKQKLEYKIFKINKLYNICKKLTKNL